MPEMQGAADMLMMPDPSTFRVLPWAPETGWFLCDLQLPRRPAGAVLHAQPAAARRCEKLAAPATSSSPGWRSSSTSSGSRDPRLQPADAGQPGNPPEVELLTTGYQLLTEHSYDQIDPVVELLRKDLEQLGLPLRSFEVEFGPSQLEFTLGAHAGMAAADAMVLLRSAVKQIARRHGYHATFMCRPKLPNVMSSGWHLHQSLTRNGLNAFASDKEDLSDIGKHYLAGLLAHARGATRARHADHQRLQALPPLLARARPRDLGQGEPRRACCA